MTGWHPISKIPEALKDGREVLFRTRTRENELVSWRRGGWHDKYMHPISTGICTHYAEITPPASE